MVVALLREVLITMADLLLVAAAAIAVEVRAVIAHMEVAHQAVVRMAVQASVETVAVFLAAHEAADEVLQAAASAASRK
jgi:hypothetical protein